MMAQRGANGSAGASSEGGGASTEVTDALDLRIDALEAEPDLAADLLAVIAEVDALQAAPEISFAPIGAAPNDNGASIADRVITLQPADATHGGVMTTGAQIIAGFKEFTDSLAAPEFSTEYITNFGGTIAIQGVVEDLPGAVAVVVNAGDPLTEAGAKILEFRNGNVEKASVTKDGAVESDSYIWAKATGFKFPDATVQSTASVDVSIGTANGLSLAAQVLSLAAAASGVTGALTAADWATFNAKAPTASPTFTGTVNSAAIVVTVAEGADAITLTGLSFIKSVRAGVGTGTIKWNGYQWEISGSAGIYAIGGITTYNTISGGASSGSAAFTQYQGARFVTNNGTNTRYMSDDGTNITFTGPLSLSAALTAVGNFETTTIGNGYILKSPDGTRYKIAVANGGALSTVTA